VVWKWCQSYTKDALALPSSAFIDAAGDGLEGVTVMLADGIMIATVKNKDANPSDRWYAAKHLVWLRRCQEQDPIAISCLGLKNARVLHMPGELFVEYQLASQKMAPDHFVVMAAYGDYAPGYVCTDIAYSQGGYESSDRASRVKPGVEKVLMDAMRELLMK